MNLLPWFAVPLAGSRGMRTSLRCRRRQGRGREGNGWGDWEKSPLGKNTEKTYTKMKNNRKKKPKTKQRVSNIFPIFSLQNKPFFQSALVEGLFQNQANAYSQERIKLYPFLIFYSSYGPVYYFSYPKYSRILLSEGLHKPCASYWPIFRSQYYPVVVVCLKIDILTKRPLSFWSATGIGTLGDEVVLEISRLLFRLKLALVNVNYVFAHFN